MSKNKMKEKPKNEEEGESRSGRLGRLDESTMGYYRRVSDTLIDGFEDEEDKEMMLKNVFSQLCEEAIKVSRNQTVSFIVQSLLKEATEDQLMSFLLAFSKDWETVCTDRFSGHVTQTLLVQIKPLLMTSKGEDSAKALFLELYGFLMGNLPVFMQDTYATHILRVVLEVLSGTDVAESVIRSKIARSKNTKDTAKSTQKPYTPPAEFKEYLKSICKKLFTMKRLKDHAENYLSNPVLQTAVLVLSKSNPDLCTEMCQQLIANTDMFEPGTNNGLPSLLVHEVGSHLVEQLLVAAPEPLFNSILEVHLVPQLVNMALDPVANFILQRTIAHAHTEEQFKLLYKNLVPNIEQLLAHNHMGVITHLADGCLKHGTKQQKYIIALMKGFHCYEPEERQMKFVTLVASLLTYDKFYKIKEGESSDDSDSDEDEEIVLPQLKEVNYHGSCLLQKLLHFGNPRLVITSLLDMKIGEIKVMTRDKFGSHIIEAFLKSPTVGEKNREKLFNKLKGTYLEMACDRLGSRVVDSLWGFATMKQREFIAADLAKQENRLRTDKFGRFIYRNLSIGHYVRRPHEWREAQSGDIKKRKLFQEMFNKNKEEQEKGVKKRKKRDQKEEANNSLKLEGSSDEEATDAQNEIDSIFATKRKRAAPEEDVAESNSKPSKKKSKIPDKPEEDEETPKGSPKKKKKKKSKKKSS